MKCYLESTEIRNLLSGHLMCKIVACVCYTGDYLKPLYFSQTTIQMADRE